ncbi:MAG TPA: serine/threonine-protein kinase, partial [Blastocatellia bacterium]|nr:serine/threonine-protein kinase [Blastocatellia bacterium]
MMDWEAHKLSDEDITLWADEVCHAALKLAPPGRRHFVTRACNGSERLKQRVDALLEADWTAPEPEECTVCQPGDVVQDCFILHRIGRGAAAEVYKAIQVNLLRVVAVKVIKNPAQRLLLVEEAKHVSQLKHENIVTVYAADFSESRSSIVMEYVEGITLRHWLELRKATCAEQSPAGADKAAIKSIVRQIALALGAAHSKRIVHRDMKPENVLMYLTADHQWRVKVVDFGLAALAHGQDVTLAGTPGYISPEQYSDGVQSDQRADIFSLGVILYEMLALDHPFLGQTEIETHYNTKYGMPKPLPAGFAGEFDTLVAKSLHKDPEQRYGRIEEFVRDLDLLDQSPPECPPGTTTPLLSELPAPIRTWVERHGYGFEVAAGAFLLAVIPAL